MVAHCCDRNAVAPAGEGGTEHVEMEGAPQCEAMCNREAVDVRQNLRRRRTTTNADWARVRGLGESLFMGLFGGLV